jgi:hypothetical protein
MSEIATPAPDSAAEAAQPDGRFVVSARDLTRVYGDGETPVHAMRYYGRTLVMVTHDARAAATADRILSPADGVIVKELSGADEHEVLSALEEITRT